MGDFAGASSLQLGDVSFRLSPACGSSSPSWAVLVAVCGQHSYEGARLEVDLLPIEDADQLARLPRTRRFLVAELSRAGQTPGLKGATKVRRLLDEARCLGPSLYAGALAPPDEPGGRPLVLWRPGIEDGRVSLPLYPVLLAHAEHNEVLLHAAAIEVDGRAVLLIGPSGAGKSTAARNAVLAGGVALADDGAILAWSKDGMPEILPLPNVAFVSATTPHPHKGRVPIGALCFLEQSAEDVLVPMDQVESLRRLVGSSMHEVPAAHFLPTPARSRIFDGLLRLVARCPAYGLRLRPSMTFYPLLRAALGADRNPSQRVA